jgi:hypothetical protein
MTGTSGAIAVWSVDAAARWNAHRRSCLSCMTAARDKDWRELCPDGWGILENHLNAQVARAGSKS